MITSEECEGLHSWELSDISGVVRLQRGKSPEVMSKTAEVLRRHGLEKESKLFAGRQSRPSSICHLFECVESYCDKLVHTWSLRLSDLPDPPNPIHYKDEGPGNVALLFLFVCDVVCSSLPCVFV